MSETTDITFRASRIMDLLVPDEIVFHEKGITINSRKLLSGDENFIFYNDISGIEIRKGVFFADIVMKPRATDAILIKNFTKGDAQAIKKLLLEKQGNR